MPPGQWQSGRQQGLLTAWGQNPECPPEFLRIAHHPRLFDQALCQSKEGSACVLDVRTRRQNAAKLTAMSASPSHTRYDSILDRKDLVDAVVPVRKRGADTLDVTLEVFASLADRPERTSKAESNRVRTDVLRKVHRGARI